MSDPARSQQVQLPPAHRDELEAILRTSGVDFARNRPVVFGSRAEGTARRYSDIDIGIAGEPLSADRLSQLAEDFEESELPYRVDIVNLAHTTERFRAVALATSIPLDDVATRS